ncbi:hypothetical protein SH2C18_32130 [Clostridium sediminicola]|uniref:DUF1292 domain-containing protein n=1 Tax=Clostridium sediminicola TaxID=3114879 RepID=UPI0031F1C713
MDNHECNCNCNGNELKTESGCGCGCGHEHEQETMPIITIPLDDNTELECNVVGVFSYKDNDYIALIPVDEEEVLLFTYEELGNEMVMNNIEDDEEYEKIEEYFFQITSESK